MATLILRLCRRIYPSSSFGIRCLAASMDTIPPVDITEKGTFKYILVTVTNKDNDDTLTLVRGYKDCEYHQDILDRVSDKLKGFECDCPGGGWINHYPERKLVELHGKSLGFGRADHTIGAQILQKFYPDYSVCALD